MDELERVKKIMLQLQLNSAQFALEIGIQGSTLSHLLHGRNKPSLDVLKKVLSRYPNINSDWLIMGIGPMFRGEKDSQTPNLFAFNDEIHSLPTVSVPSTPSNSTAPLTSIQESKSHVEQTSSISAPEAAVLAPNIHHSAVQSIISEIPPKSVKKIIVYYTDNTFQEFMS